MNRRIPFLVLALLLLGALGLYLVNRKPAAPELPAEETASAPQAPTGAPEPPVQPGAAPDVRRDSGADVARPQETQEGAKLAPVAEGTPVPPGYPKSRVPHRVLRAWGATNRGSPRGVIGFLIVVDPPSRTRS
jgi:hypothetical protein